MVLGPSWGHFILGKSIWLLHMSSRAKILNDLFLQEMRVGRTRTLVRIRDLWWDEFESHCDQNGASESLDQLDSFMEVSRDRLNVLARLHADKKGHSPGTDEYRQAETQFLKSNTGKMFERFVGLALCHALVLADSPYCLLPFRGDTLEHCSGMKMEDLSVKFSFADDSLATSIDADLFAFNAMDPNDEIFLLSIKSTLKDRFHNVPFWNLLRRASLSQDMPDVVAVNPQVLKHIKYVAICSDLAEEQPDFGTEAGARNLLKIDAALLDGAYVTSSRAKGLPEDCTNHFGNTREHAFYRYSCFYKYLADR